MRRYLTGMAASLLCVVMLTQSAHGWGGGRYISGGHPYHNGWLFVPPESAYSGVTLTPPMWYGAPAYYYPQSYLAPGAYYGPIQYPATPMVLPQNVGYPTYGPTDQLGAISNMHPAIIQHTIKPANTGFHTTTLTSSGWIACARSMVLTGC